MGVDVREEQLEQSQEKFLKSQSTVKMMNTEAKIIDESIVRESTNVKTLSNEYEAREAAVKRKE